MKPKDCKKCAFCVEVIAAKMFFCRKLGMSVYPHINGNATCVWYKEEADEEELQHLPDLWP